VIGIDIVKISRIESFIERFGDKALDRFMSKGEQKRAKKYQTKSKDHCREEYSQVRYIQIGN